MVERRDLLLGAGEGRAGSRSRRQASSVDHMATPARAQRMRLMDLCQRHSSVKSVKRGPWLLSQAQLLLVLEHEPETQQRQLEVWLLVGAVQIVDQHHAGEPIA